MDPVYYRATAPPCIYHTNCQRKRARGGRVRAATTEATSAATAAAAAAATAAATCAFADRCLLRLLVTGGQRRRRHRHYHHHHHHHYRRRIVCQWKRLKRSSLFMLGRRPEGTVADRN